MNFANSILKYVIPVFIFLNIIPSIRCQDNKRFDKNDYTSYKLINSDKNNGFSVSVSLVAMFTTGAADRNGFRLGAGISVYQQIGDWALSTGLDSYKGESKFEFGIGYLGFSYDDDTFGSSYYLTKYFQGESQISGILGIHLDDFRIRFEDDILAIPFTKFVLHDRYRSAALEIQYRHILIGTNVYTTEANGLTKVSLNNSKGVYTSGKQISSPVYIGYTNKNLIVRYGTSDRVGGYIAQNWWHQKFFDTTDFEYGTYENHFLQVGVNKPYTLY